MIEEHTIQTPLWIRSLVEDVLVEAFQPLAFMGPLGYRYSPPNEEDDDKAWQLAVYPTAAQVKPNEEKAGMVFVSAFSLNVGHVVECLQDVSELVWHSPTKYSGELDGPEIRIRGKFAGREVRLRVFNRPPADEPPAFLVDPQTSEAVELPA